MRDKLSPAEQRTWDMQIACACAHSVHCLRYHGLPMPASEFMALLPGVAAHDKQRARLYEAYDQASPEDRKEAFSRMTAPFNSYV